MSFNPPEAATTLIDYQGGTNPVYLGKAQSVAADPTQPVWQLTLLTYDANNNPTAVQYAGGSVDYAFIWNNRSTYRYQ